MDQKNKQQADLIVFPDFQKLKEEVEKLRTELSRIVLERDELQYVICRNIETKYMLKLGGLEYKVYEAQCEAMRLKRKTELIQAKKNRREQIILPEIEKILDIEFSEYQKNLNEQIEKMNDALKRSQAQILSEEDQKELKKRYHHIIKTLHPDIHPEITATQTEMFQQAVLAYKNGDLNTLRIIDEIACEDILPEKHQDAMSRLAEEKKRLEKLMKSVRESIAAIKSRYPYSVKDIIEDPEKTRQKRSELEGILSQYRRMIEDYKRRLKEMLR